MRVSAASSVCVLGSGLLPSRERDRTLEAPLHCDPSPAASVRRARLSLFLLLRRQGTGGHCSSSSSRYAGLRLACARSGLAAHCPLPSHQNAAAAASAAADAVVAAQTAADSGALAAAFAVTLSAAFDADPNGAGANSATQVRGAKAWSVVASPCPASACLAASALSQAYAAALARGGVSVSVSNMTTSGSGGSAAGSSTPSSGRALSGGAVAGIVVAVLAVVFAAAALNLVYQRTHARSVRDGVVTTKGLPEGSFPADMVASSNPMRATY